MRTIMFWTTLIWAVYFGKSARAMVSVPSRFSSSGSRCATIFSRPSLSTVAVIQSGFLTTVNWPLPPSTLISSFQTVVSELITGFPT